MRELFNRATCHLIDEANAPDRLIANMFATDPARGLSLSR